jgi:hypothetical protein
MQRDNAAGVTEEILAGARQEDLLRRALQQGLAGDLLELAHLRRDRRLRAGERGGGAGEGAQFRDGDEGTQQVDVDIAQCRHPVLPPPSS